MTSNCSSTSAGPQSALATAASSLPNNDGILEKAFALIDLGRRDGVTSLGSAVDATHVGDLYDLGEKSVDLADSEHRRRRRQLRRHGRRWTKAANIDLEAGARRQADQQLERWRRFVDAQRATCSRRAASRRACRCNRSAAAAGGCLYRRGHRGARGCAAQVGVHELHRDRSGSAPIPASITTAAT